MNHWECGLFRLRPFGQDAGDYGLLHRLSNLQVPQDPEGNREWQKNRREFDETKRARRHYIAHHVPTGEPVAYAAIEQQEPDSPGFRLYLVFDPRRWSYSVLGAFLYRQLLKDAGEMGAATLAFVEYANDSEFMDFLRDQGFEQIGTAVYNGFDIVRMEKSLER